MGGGMSNGSAPMDGELVQVPRTLGLRERRDGVGLVGLVLGLEVHRIGVMGRGRSGFPRG